MISQSKTFTAIALPLVCLAAGWVSARQLHGLGSTPDPEPATPPPLAAAAIPVAPGEDAPSDEVVRYLESLAAAAPEDWQTIFDRLPATQLRAYLTSQPTDNTADLRQYAASRLGALDGQAAFEFIAKLPGGQDQHALLANALGGWGETEPRAALAWAAPQRDAPHWAESLFNQVALRDPNQANEMLALPELVEFPRREYLLYQLGSVLFSRSPDDALRWLEGLPPRDLVPASGNLLGALARTNPAESAALIARMPPTQSLDEGLTVAAQWAIIDPGAALEWTASLPQNTFAWDARRTVLLAWADTDPIAVWRHLQALDPEESRTILEAELETRIISAVDHPGYQAPPGGVDTIGTSLYSHLQGDAAEQLLATLGKSPDTKTRQIALALELQKLAGAAPAAAIERATAELGSGDATRMVLHSLLDNLTDTDPQRAVAVATSLPPNLQDSGVALAMGAWAAWDPDAAGAFIATMEPGATRDSAIEGYSSGLAQINPERAAGDYLGYLAKHGTAEPPDRLSAISAELALAWFLQDPAAAGKWAAGIAQPEARRNALQLLYNKWTEFGPATARARLVELGIGNQEIDTLGAAPAS